MPRGSVLRIQPVELRRDAAEFECVVSGDDGEDYVVTATLDVYKSREGREQAASHLQVT